MFSTLKQRFLFFLESMGWQWNPKEWSTFNGVSILATKGAFFRKNEKDDAWLYQLSRVHENIIDVGCNIGQSSLLMLLGTRNRMICVDPNPKALSLCAENLIYNRLSTQANFVNAFVGDVDDQEIDFYTVGSGAAGSMFSSFAKTAAQYGKSIKVRTRTLAMICKELNFQPNLIKVDVEGAEQVVLKGMGEEVLRLKPTIFVEVHSGLELSIIDNTRAILEWCDKWKYSAFYLKLHSQLTDVNIIAKRGRYHLLLLPEGRPYPEYLAAIKEGAKLNTR